MDIITEALAGIIMDPDLEGIITEALAGIIMDPDLEGIITGPLWVAGIIDRLWVAVGIVLHTAEAVAVACSR